ncbi:Hypothetical protein, putative [Bodo saltans]|uniref:Uncharacterized protein n=1 Tax=Bodo saltans TaxID=75058 RepID=A0A0S4IWP0_BODSA|nr:Hypothetical protein, putative [Bodo saltans]|eukprot:CUG31358.1 Hypothetical protein, putative [Bodo saltans]
MLLDGNFGLVSTGEEAVKLQRRLLRLKGRTSTTPALGDDDLVGALLFVHVAQTQPAEHMYATVDGRMAGMDDADVTDTSSLPVNAWRQLHDTCKILKTMQHHNRSSAIFLCCNLFAESFTMMDDGLLLVHCSMGCGNTWTSTSAQLAEILSSLFVHR